MKLVFTELPADYSIYSFPYQVWAEKEPTDSLTNLLSQGFLPARKKINLFYLARSLRIDLSRFKISSENRRVRKKTANFDFAVVSQGQFRLTAGIVELAVNYSKKAYREGVPLSVSSVKRIFSRYLCSHVFVWTHRDGQRVGYSPVWADDRSVYYWGGFIDPTLKISGLGLRMMLETVVWAQENSHEFIYLGTVYTVSSLYKTNFTGAEWFNGKGWVRDLGLPIKAI